MAQLKDLLVSGPSRLIGKLFANEVQLTTLNIPTTSNGTTYGPGTNNYVPVSNGTSIYWSSAAPNATTAAKLGSNAGSSTQPIYFANGVPTAITGNIANGTTGNAATATAFSSNATVTLTGDATGTSAGSTKSWSVPVTLANSGATAGSYGNDGNVSPSAGGTFLVPYVTVDAKGRVTAISNKTITLPTASSSASTITTTEDTTNTLYVVGVTSSATTTLKRDTSVTVTGGTLTATTLSSNGVNANVANSNSAGGLSLYSTTPTSYGIAMRAGAAHGWITAAQSNANIAAAQGISTSDATGTDWAINFYNSGSKLRGFKFLHGGSSIASLNGYGYMQVNRLGLNRVGGTKFGRLYWYNAAYYTWVDYMSDSSAGNAPNGGQSAQLGNVTGWAKRSLIENSSGYGWVWEAASNTAIATTANTTQPTARMALSSSTGYLRLAPNASSDTCQTGGLIIDSSKNASSGNVAIELWRGNNASWQIANNSGTLYFKDNYTTAAQTTYTSKFSIAYNTGTVTARAIQPEANNTYALGTSSLKWSNVYATTFTGSLSGNAATASKLGSSTLGSATKPIYLSSGSPTECSTYAGGTAVTLNNASKAASTASFYAPTTGGTQNTQALVGNGATAAPKWVDISPSSAWTAGTTAGPVLKITVLGQTQATGATIPSASATASGVVTTGAQQFVGRKTFGYMTRKAVNDSNEAVQWVGDTYLVNGAGTAVGEYWYNCGNATNITTGQYSWRQYSPNSTANTSTTGKYETYSLPAVAVGLTENKSYSILTTKSAVSVAQGGTGATTAAGARTNLGLGDLATINKPSSNQTTTFLRGDGTWQAANNYSLPLAANGTRGGVQIGYTQSGKNYPVQLSSEKMYVNVPWTDTTYSNFVKSGSTAAAGLVPSPGTTAGVERYLNEDGTWKKVYESFLSWGGKNFSASYGPIDAAMVDPLGANRFAFLKAAGLTIEYSTNGGSNWTDYGATNAQKVGLFSNGYGFYLGKHTSKGSSTVNDQLRVTIDTGAAQIYTVLNKIVIYMSTNGNGTQVKIEKALQSTPTTYSTHLDWTGISGWSGWNILNINDITTYGNTAGSQYGRIRFTFKQSSVNSGSYPAAVISCIMGFGGMGWTVPSNMARDGHLYSYDADQNATFPATVTATSFSGSLTGNVTGNVSGSSGSCTGNAAKATAANITTTANAVAYYTNTTGTFGSKASANGALYATSANGALSWGTLPVAQGGTGLTSSPSMLVNLASTNAANVLQASPRPGVTGILPLGNGGTGASTAKGARVNLGLGDAKVYHGNCTTAAGTAQKDVTLDSADFTDTQLVKGVVVFVTFTNTNSAAVGDLKLKVGTSTAKPLKREYNASTANIAGVGWIRANCTYMFAYDGTNWVNLTDNQNSTYYVEAVYSSTAAATAAKVGSSSAYTLQKGYFSFFLVNTNTAASAITLNISSTGAKTVYLNGAVTSSSNYNWTKGYYIGYYDGTYYHFRTDGFLPYSNSVHYGTALPASGAEGQIFYQVSPECYEIPTGGRAGALLQKNSAADRDIGWTNSVYVSGGVLYGAAWNDYAEYRETTTQIEPGRVVIENGDDTLSLSTERLQPGAEIVSDTFGFAIGETEKAKTPLAASGRVLAYPNEPRRTYKPGQPVCSGPHGTVSQMTDEEARMYPWLIIGTVSAIPEYDTWGEDNIKVNGRIWIRIR